MAQNDFNDNDFDRGTTAASGRREQLRERVTGTLDGAPLASIAGAVAFGAAAAALLPVSRRERQAIGPVGRKLRGYAGDAVQAAKAAGAEHLTAKGLTTAALSSGVGQAAGHFLTAAFAASTAASQSVRSKRSQGQGAQSQGSQAQGSQAQGAQGQGGQAQGATTSSQAATVNG